MKLKDFILGNNKKKALLTENYKNITEPEDKYKYAEKVFELCVVSYSRIAGGFAYKDVDTLVNTTGLWKIKTSNTKIIAGRIYKDRNGTNKSVASFCEKSNKGRDALFQIYRDDVNFGRSYGEVSGKVEDIIMKNPNAIQVPNVYVSDILDKPIKPSPNGYHYTRKIGGMEHEKLLVTGDLSLFKDIDMVTK